MNNYTLSLADDELAYCKSHLRGYVRRLIQTDMGKSVAKKQLESMDVISAEETKERLAPDVIAEVKKSITQLPRRSSGKNINPNDQCKKCGQMKVLGKCPVCGK